MLDVDASQHVRVLIEDGGLLAVIELAPTLAPGSLDEMTAQALVQTRGVQINDKVLAAIREAVTLARDAPDPNGPRRVVIARGTQAVHGEAGRLEFCPGFDPRDRERRLTQAAEGLTTQNQSGVTEPDTHQATDQAGVPAMSTQGDSVTRIDHYTKGLFTLARPGERIATVHPPLVGLDGADVTGRTILARQGVKLRLILDDSLLLTPQGELFAQRAGVVEHAPPLVRVSQVISIPGSIDFATGHVDFPGTVVVGRTVTDGFRLTAARDVVVHGLVEAAELRAGRDGQFHGGVASKEKGRVAVGRDCTCKYLNNADAVIGRDLRVSKEIINSRLSVGRALLSPVACITGGYVRAGDRVEIAELGSEAGVSTVLELAIIGELAGPIAQAEALLPQMIKRREKLVAQLEPLRKFAGKLKAGDAEKLTELEFEYRRVIDKIGPIEQRLQRLRDLLEAQTSVDVTVYGRIHAKVQLVTPGFTVDFIKELRGPVRITAHSRSAEPKLCTPDGKASGELTHYARVRKLDSLSAARAA